MVIFNSYLSLPEGTMFFSPKLHREKMAFDPREFSPKNSPNVATWCNAMNTCFLATQDGAPYVAFSCLISD